MKILQDDVKHKGEIVPVHKHHTKTYGGSWHCAELQIN
jgi:hypothetical protein